ncbi:ribosomal RNA processing protein 1 homolog A [Dasypus novemcinctus]|uniref:ribosomal RNA processing protein 1 homolog A n=1 Tax=Dasypus novemcinctus TaxID=9361 RepID=UPI00265FEBC8|nr:ribosomal RNA processing protein 1 homolog A [Dasypus novemcinctus]
MVSRVQLPPEIQLAQRLAGNEKVTRDRAVRKLRKYIVARTQRAAGGFTHDELLKVWKGLFYCMWMQDKPLLQEELGRTIAQLIHAFQTTEAQHLFLQTFWQTINREWMGIDRLRLDKYYMLMRMVLNESLKVLKTHAWDERQVEQLLKLLTTEILHPDSQAPNGVKAHFIEIFLEELTRVGAQELTADQNLQFVDPFCRIAARTKDALVLHNIARGVFEAIVEQAPFAIEELMNELDAQEEAEVSGDETPGGEDCDPDEASKLPCGKPPPGSAGRAELEAGDDGAGDDGDSAGAVLQFDYGAVADRLYAAASRQSTPSLNRKRLYKVVRKLQALAEGHFPEDDIPEKAYRGLREGRLERKKKRRLPKSRLQNKKGRGEEDMSPDPSSGSTRKRRRKGVRADPAEPSRAKAALLQGQSRGPGDRGPRQRKRLRQPPASKAKVANGASGQEPRKKKKRTPESEQ